MEQKDDQQALREHVVRVLSGRGAHVDFDKAVADLPADLRGARADGISHTAWRLLEHLRICQWDILEYTRDPKHVSPDFPQGYWPSEDGPPSDDAWDASVESFRQDLRSMQTLVEDPAVDLLTPIPHGIKEHTVLREALLIADHNAYHLGQLVIVRKALGAWPA